MSTPVKADSDTISFDVQKTFNSMREAYRENPYISYESRMDILEKIERILLENDLDICRAISDDFGNRSYHETKILEIVPAVMGLRYTRKHLKKWMKTQKRDVSLVFFGGKNRVIPQAKGVVGIVTPWNYPLFLALSPLTSAIAAGNRVMIKQASNSQRLSSLLQKTFSEVIAPDHISVLPGVSASDFTSVSFDHLIFTGSPDVGRTVMNKASASLTPVTLELGGKSPTIVAADFDMQKAAERILYAKLINSGQTCVSPDYLFVPEGRVEDFVEKARNIVKDRYPSIKSKDYTAIIDERAFQRLSATMDDAREKGATVINLLDGEQLDADLQKISPAVLTDVNDEMTVMQDEIFGPLFPVMPYKNLEEVVAYINRRERPLALYLFTDDKLTRDFILKHTISGGVTINDCAMHVAQHDMPFGGIGNSGMGQYHSYEGFMEFSKLRPVFQQAKRALTIAPPYGKTFDRIYRFVTGNRWVH